MPISISQLKKVQFSPEEEAKQRAEFAQTMKEISERLLKEFSVQSVLRDFSQSIKDRLSLQLKDCFSLSAKESRVLPVTESSFCYSQHYVPSPVFQKRPDVRVIVQPIIIIVDRQ